jgi:bifunctional lysine-specific demethylase and histidyl-hydroxylase MINA
MMIVSDAENLVARVLAPISTEALFDAVRDSVSLAQTGDGSAVRANLLGPDPAATLLAAHTTLAPLLDCHAVAPLGPPPGPAPVPDATAFRAMIEAYHDRGYTVRLPGVRALSPELLGFVRALEILLQQPVDASVFWSRAGAQAKIHYDNNDNFAIQLAGRKRWYVSSDAAGLQNSWRDVAEAAPHHDRHRVIDVGPGDLLYIPRGLPHSVDATIDSIHVAILFTPMTLRAAMLAALDHASELSRVFRTTVGVHGGATVAGLPEAFRQLSEACRRPDYVDGALTRAGGRGIADLARLVPVAPVPPLLPQTRLRHALLGAMHLRETSGGIEIAVPGGRIPVHASAGSALAFIAATPVFTLASVPGLEPPVALALVERLTAAGVLEPEL